VYTKETSLAVQWADALVEDVPVVSATGLELLAVDRFLRFMRPRNPNHARYFSANNQKRPARALAQFS
jgi:hypothetical protein